MTLHQTSVLIFKSLKRFLIFGGIIVALILVINITRIIVKIMYPPPPDYPNVLFGKLAPIAFPDPTVKESFTYSIETLSGTLPTFPDRVKIYKTVTQPVTLLNVKNARNKVANVGFVDQVDSQYREFPLTTTRYQWQVVTNDLLRTIVMNTDTYDFKLTSTYRTYPPIVNQSRVGDEINTKKVALSFLGEMSLPVDDVDLDKSKFQSLMLKNGVLIPAENVSATQVFRLDLFQADIDELPVFYPYHPNSTMYFLLMARVHGVEDVIESSFNHQQKTEESASYPIKSAKEAYDELISGKAYISNYYGVSRSIPITDVTLGYYVGESRQEYIIPVILFQSKENFFAFVPAIKEACLTTSSASIDECQGKPVEKK